MNIQTTPPESLLFVEVNTPNQPRYWCRISRLLENASEAERQRTISLLKAGQPISYETSGICIQAVTMFPVERQRLAYLQTFETGGFRLGIFRPDSALFYRDSQQYYYSMREMIERDYLPTQLVAVDSRNIPIISRRGHMIDVFVPVGNALASFRRSFN